MNYRHAFHAGNQSDVFKHAVLAAVLTYMKQKPAPFRFIDTHAGIGIYDLTSEKAMKTGEWEVGIARMRKAKRSPALNNLVGDYMAVQDKVKPLYAGSPQIAAEMLRPGDKALLIEKHERDSVTLKNNYIWAQNVKVIARDGYEALNALLPAVEKRAVILIDPPFEEEGEEDRLLDALALILKKMPTAVALLWYPVKEMARVNRLLANAKSFKHDKLINMLCMFKAPDDVSLAGNGLIILNPPFGLEATVRQASKEFCEALKLPNGFIRIDKL
jgi:23S rRNA (adenine2030-N6)-methyltransferase